jgi:molybdopterin-guanine dinucleotide biosynthesis protein A
MDRILGLVLAGGKSSRMGGGDKCFLDLSGKSLITRVIHRLSPQVEALAISAGEKDVAALGARHAVLRDSPSVGVGPLAGLLAGLEWAQANGFMWVASIPCDVPFLPRDLIQRLRDAAEGRDAAIACSGKRRHHVIGLWSVAVAGALNRRIVEDGMREAGAWAASIRIGLAAWPLHPYDPFHNINLPADLEEARRIAAEFNP